MGDIDEAIRVLGLPSLLSPADVREAYRARSEPLQNEASKTTQEFARVQQAYFTCVAAFFFFCALALTQRDRLRAMPMYSDHGETFYQAPEVFGESWDWSLPPVKPGGRTLTKQEKRKFPRNAKCYCGSGNKYKTCCREKDETEELMEKLDKRLAEHGKGKAARKKAPAPRAPVPLKSAAAGSKAGSRDDEDMPPLAPADTLDDDDLPPLADADSLLALPPAPRPASSRAAPAASSTPVVAVVPSLKEDKQPEPAAKAQQQLDKVLGASESEPAAACAAEPALPTVPQNAEAAAAAPQTQAAITAVPATSQFEEAEFSFSPSAPVATVEASPSTNVRLVRRLGFGSSTNAAVTALKTHESGAAEPASPPMATNAAVSAASPATPDEARRIVRAKRGVLHNSPVVLPASPVTHTVSEPRSIADIDNEATMFRARGDALLEVGKLLESITFYTQAITALCQALNNGVGSDSTGAVSRKTDLGHVYLARARAFQRLGLPARSRTDCLLASQCFDQAGIGGGASSVDSGSGGGVGGAGKSGEGAAAAASALSLEELANLQSYVQPLLASMVSLRHWLGHQEGAVPAAFAPLLAKLKEAEGLALASLSSIQKEALQ